MQFYYHQTGGTIRIESFITAFDRILPNDCSFPGEMHDFWEIVCVLDGNLRVSGDDRVYDLQKNQIIFHKPMELHKFHALSPGKIFVLTFHLSGSSANRFCNRSFRLLPKQIALLYDILDALRSYPIPLVNNEHNYMSAFYDNPLYLQQAACRTELFLISLLQDNSHCLHSSNNAETSIYKATIHFMEQHLTEWITIAQMAQALSISSSCLKRIFAKYGGMSIHKYFLKQKILCACNMLAEGKRTAEIADHLNFSSPNYFSMVFKRETGQTPSEFKDSLQ